MEKTTYYVRICPDIRDLFELYLTTNEVTFAQMSTDMVDAVPSLLYYTRMNPTDAFALRLSIPVTGCINFNRTGVVNTV